MTTTPQKPKTRAQVIELLRRGQRTVDELARELGITDNAVRMHLMSLEQEGLVRQEGVRRSGTAGKPAVIYGIHPDAEPVFSKAYAPLLASVVDALAARLSPAELEEVFRTAGRRLAALQPALSGQLVRRVRAASALLNQLGALSSVEDQNEFVVLRGVTCPLSVAVSRRKEVCKAVEELLTVLVGARVEQRCEYQPRPNCCFVLSERAS